MDTQWTLDSVGELEKAVILATYQIRAGQEQATGFLIKSGYMVTVAEIIKNKPHKEDISALSSLNEIIHFSDAFIDEKRGLALLIPPFPLKNGLELDVDSPLKMGESVCTWGYPLGEEGTRLSPLLSTGYLAGFKAHHIKEAIYKHLILQGSFQTGKGGGPLLKTGSNKVRGVIRFKEPSLNPLYQLLQTLMNNKLPVKSGEELEKGEKKPLSGTPLINEVLQSQYPLFQTLEEAIDGHELGMALIHYSLYLYKNSQETAAPEAIKKIKEAIHIIESHFPQSQLVIIYYSHLGQIYQKINERDKASDAFEKALKMNEFLRTQKAHEDISIQCNRLVDSFKEALSRALLYDKKALDVRIRPANHTACAINHFLVCGQSNPFLR